MVYTHVVKEFRTRARSPPGPAHSTEGLTPRSQGIAASLGALAGGALFPHLYRDLPMTAVCWVRPLELGPDGHHLFPDLG